MSNDNSAKLPLWVQDRDTVIAQDEGVEWRNGERPDYSHTNQFLKAESKFNHLEGSLEAIVQNLVRTFEMEASHKTNPQQWLSIVNDKFRMSSNGGAFYTAQDVSDQGTYNLFINDSKEYSATQETFESSFELFHKAFPNGFLWEVTKVISGPPEVTFKWRHWGTFNGPYKDHQPTGETIEIVGLSVARVTDDLKIIEVEHYFDNSTFLQKLTSGCPFHQTQQ
ncbi:MAG TPA: SnoaL-like polyketide cyclase [Cyanothece sp. UBA12306]|nr:SnoaL-like polyketide cyclase [Cyanothece sp. UBA12306]